MVQQEERHLLLNEHIKDLKGRCKNREHDSRLEHCLSRESPGYYFGARALRPRVFESMASKQQHDAFSTWTSAGKLHRSKGCAGYF